MSDRARPRAVGHARLRTQGASASLSCGSTTASAARGARRRRSAIRDIYGWRTKVFCTRFVRPRGARPLTRGGSSSHVRERERRRGQQPLLPPHARSVPAARCGSCDFALCKTADCALAPFHNRSHRDYFYALRHERPRRLRPGNTAAGRAAREIRNCRELSSARGRSHHNNPAR